MTRGTDFAFSLRMRSGPSYGVSGTKRRPMGSIGICAFVCGARSRRTRRVRADLGRVHPAPRLSQLVFRSEKHRATWPGFPRTTRCVSDVAMDIPETRYTNSD